MVRTTQGIPELPYWQDYRGEGRGLLFWLDNSTCFELHDSLGLDAFLSRSMLASLPKSCLSLLIFKCTSLQTVQGTPNLTSSETRQQIKEFQLKLELRKE